MKLYSSSLQMIREIFNKYAPSYVVSLDKIHFAAIFHFPTKEKADITAVQNGISTACSMVHNYFNVWLSIGIGSAVDAVSYTHLDVYKRQHLYTAQPDAR